MIVNLTLDIWIKKRTTNVRNPWSKSPTSSVLQKRLSSASRNCEFKKLTKWWSSAQDGSRIPQYLQQQKKGRNNALLVNAAIDVDFVKARFLFWRVGIVFSKQSRGGLGATDCTSRPANFSHIPTLATTDHFFRENTLKIHL